MDTIPLSLRFPPTSPPVSEFRVGTGANKYAGGNPGQPGSCGAQSYVAHSTTDNSSLPSREVQNLKLDLINPLTSTRKVMDFFFFFFWRVKPLKIFPLTVSLADTKPLKRLSKSWVFFPFNIHPMHKQFSGLFCCLHNLTCTCKVLRETTE